MQLQLTLDAQSFPSTNPAFVYPTGTKVAVFNTVHQAGRSNATTIADYIAVGALMIVLILWSATRLFPDYLRSAALITLILWAATRLFAQRKL
jgi:hypothetical protein